MKDLKPDASASWQHQHWKTICSCYNKSPWFDQYRAELEKLYRTPVRFVIDWNLITSQWICDKMSIRTRIDLSCEKWVEGEEDIDDQRALWTPAFVRQQADTELRYPQVFEERLGFVPGLSILDYLFCVGNNKGND